MPQHAEYHHAGRGTNASSVFNVFDYDDAARRSAAPRRIRCKRCLTLFLHCGYAPEMSIGPVK